MKKYFLVVLVVFLTSCISKYETNTLFEDGGYKYNITYPVSKNNKWNLFYGSTDATMYKLDDGNILHTTAILTRQSLNPSCSIEAFLLDKNGKIYESWIKELKSGELDIPYNIENFSDLKYNKLNISRDIFEKLYEKNMNKKNINKDNLMEIFVDLGKNRILLFVFDNENNKKLEKEIYKIIASLTREKINNQNNNAKQ